VSRHRSSAAPQPEMGNIGALHASSSCCCQVWHSPSLWLSAAVS
jgi:hypothetical protein